MKTLLLIFTLSLFAISCKKETLNNNIYGDWYFIEAYETDSFDDEYDLLIDYENVTITFNRDDSFVWFQDGIEYAGTFDKGVNKITLNFDDGDKEVWRNYNLNRNKNTLSYNYYSNDDSYFEFKLEKITTNYSRR